MSYEHGADHDEDATNGCESCAREPEGHLLSGDVEIRSFAIRDSHVHACAPGMHGDPSGRWRVYYREHADRPYPVKIADGGATFEDAVVTARKLAEVFR